MSLTLGVAPSLQLSPRVQELHAGTPGELQATLRPARIEIWCSSMGSGRLRDSAGGTIYDGPFEAAPASTGEWRIERLDDRSGRGRHFGIHGEASAPAYIRSARVLGGRPAIRTVELDTSGFIMRFGWQLRRPLAMFAVLEGSGSNRVISESINRMDDPVPDLANIIDFATSTARDNPVPVAFQNGNGTPGTTKLELGRAHVVGAIWAGAETFVRVDGVQEGYERGLTNGIVADSLSLLNNPTVRHGQNRWLGHFGEYVLISGALDAARIAAVERHLAARFGLPLAG